MWQSIPTDEVIAATAENLQKRNINTQIVSDRAAALQAVKGLLPEKAEVMTGSSTTLNEIGMMDYLQGSDHNHHYLAAEVWAEGDPQARAQKRRLAIGADYYLASVNAIAQTGALVSCDATGSRVGAYPYGAGKLILVAGVNKITTDLSTAMQRVREHVFPLEDKRAQAAYGAGSSFGKWVIIENEVKPDRIHLILVKEVLGY